MSPEPAAEKVLTAATLLAAAESIRNALADIPAGPNIAALTQAVAEIQRISALRQSSMPAASLCDAGSAFDAALTSYRSALEAWAKELPRIHGLLLAEKHRLETRHEHVHTLRTWMDAQQQTR